MTMTHKLHQSFPRLTVAASAILAALAVTGCLHGPRLVTADPPPIPDGGPTIPDDNKIVLAPGTQIVADSAAGHIKIEAGPGARRVFDWDGLRRGAIIKPRDKPFAGSDYKGIYFDGKPDVWAPARGITKLRYEEGRRNFDNADDALIWMQIRRLYYTYNDNGLVVGWKRQGDTLHAEVWQFYIDGSKPTSMPDANDTHIAAGPLKAEPQKMHPRLVFADGHSEPYTTDNADEYHGAGSSGNKSWLGHKLSTLFDGTKSASSDASGSSTANGKVKGDRDSKTQGDGASS